ncbi:MAG TPA: hypothetical protein VF140_06435, partial [Phycicoccus sp.]
MTAPVQVLVIGLNRLQFDGSVRAELDRLRDAGTVRVVDVLLVNRSEDGSFSTLPPPPGLPAETGSVVAGLLGSSEVALAGADGTGAPEDGPDAGWSLDGAVPPGTTAAVALVEHLWAEPLRDAIRTAGGTPLGETWLAEEDLDRLSAL